MSEVKEVQSAIAGYIGKVLRESFGKGPISVHTTWAPPYFCVHIRDFLVPMEQILIQKNEGRKVEELREMLMGVLYADIKAELEAVTGEEILDIYTNWNLHHRSGVIFGTIDTPLEQESGTADKWQEEVNSVVKKAGENKEGLSAVVDTKPLNHRVVLIERTSVLTPVERQLIEEGHAGEIEAAKTTLVKSIIEETNLLALMPREVIDPFIIWDLDKDINYLIFICSSKESEAK
ncbi:hypothetical protein CHL76_04210 [Marinococcus halophilus]|uniref:Na+-translocating membrane potential-generating system MpsC domain-containing protein n=1 Tax=Marinococcus halophilus TaxID=1371 RepID=A0A510Y7P1_MARHA|nr:Na-translocating system protein MpsC family protein [Marinococcus halophilus]OZT80991.1 hypothetical protein CHL76_04210 [Marinococcus halophilus]GEK59375.1 hypothetical protein MHA01_22800 [Marinococcus halophilus]